MLLFAGRMFLWRLLSGVLRVMIASMMIAVGMGILLMRDLTWASLAMSLSATRPVAGRTLPKVQGLPSHHLDDVQGQNGKAKNLSGEAHRLSRCGMDTSKI